VHLFSDSSFMVIKRKTLSFVFALCVICFVASAQDDGTTTNNWNSMPDLAPTEVSWDYALSPAWYFWFGVGIGIFTGLTGCMVKAFQTVTSSGDAGGTQ
jgi:hypothetical protein